MRPHLKISILEWATKEAVPQSPQTKVWRCIRDCTKNKLNCVNQLVDKNFTEFKLLMVMQVLMMFSQFRSHWFICALKHGVLVTLMPLMGKKQTNSQCYSTLYTHKTVMNCLYINILVHVASSTEKVLESTSKGQTPMQEEVEQAVYKKQWTSGTILCFNSYGKNIMNI